MAIGLLPHNNIDIPHVTVKSQFSEFFVHIETEPVLRANRKITLVVFMTLTRAVCDVVGS